MAFAFKRLQSGVFLCLLCLFWAGSLGAAETKPQPPDQEGTLQDFPRDFEPAPFGDRIYGPWVYGFGAGAGFEEKDTVASLHGSLRYFNNHWSAKLFVPIVFHEQGTQKDNNYTVDSFGFRDTQSPGGYDYFDDGGDFLWYIDHVQYQSSGFLVRFAGEDRLQFGSSTLIQDWSLIGYHAGQNRRSLQGRYETESSKWLYVNDDALPNFHLLGFETNPWPKHNVFKYFATDVLLYVDTDPLDFEAGERFANPSASFQQYIGVSVNAQTPVYVDVDHHWVLPLRMQSIFRDGSIYGAELGMGIGSISETFEWHVLALYEIEGMPRTPFFSPMFEYTRLEIGRGKMFDTEVGGEAKFRVGWSDGWYAFSLLRGFSETLPYLGWGIEYDKKGSPFSFLFGWYRRYILHFPYFMRSHSGDAVTRINASYDIFSTLNASLDVFIEPVPQAGRLKTGQTAQTQLILRTTFLIGSGNK